MAAQCDVSPRATRSRLGALALHTGGLLVGNGRMRVNGAAATAVCGRWHRSTVSRHQPASGARVVGHDVLGGRFEVNDSDPAAIGRLLENLIREDVAMAGCTRVELDDDDWSATLRGIRGALRHGGYLVFETRRPE